MKALSLLSPFFFMMKFPMKKQAKININNIAFLASSPKEKTVPT
jgi:hypothetical protein